MTNRFTNHVKIPLLMVYIINLLIIVLDLKSIELVWWVLLQPCLLLHPRSTCMEEIWKWSCNGYICSHWSSNCGSQTQLKEFHWINVDQWWGETMLTLISVEVLKSWIWNLCVNPLGKYYLEWEAGSYTLIAVAGDGRVKICVWFWKLSE